MLIWSYLVLGEFVLDADFPELFATLLVLPLGAMTLIRSERRFAHLLQALTLRERAKHALLVLVLSLAYFARVSLQARCLPCKPRELVLDALEQGL